MNNSNRRTTKQSRKLPYALAAVLLLVITALIGGIVYASGYRYIKGDGVKYSGFTYEGQPINGKVKYADGTKGKLTKEKDSDRGMIVYSSGDVYEGGIKGIYRNGKGTLEYKETGAKYVGDFADDKLTGSAVVTSADGSKYEGEVKDGKKDGIGKFTFSDGSYYYGEWKDNKRDGLGEEHYSDGSYYYGSFANDKKSGSGEVMVNLENGMVYMGKCKFVFANGDEYTGDFTDGARTGRGTYKWTTGETYTGEFLDGQMHGVGTYDFGNGKEPYTGEFVNGELVSEKEESAENVEDENG
ncbi:MAG: hypothetical protein J5844_03965 [Clostridia bacterium]|nr:hypothetical protein [Clostridia bacterium]